MNSIVQKAERLILKTIFSFPSEAVLKAFGQKPVFVQGQRLHPEMQLYLLMRKLKKSPAMGDLPPVESRLAYVKDSLVHGARIDHILVEDFIVHEGVKARLYKVNDEVSPVIIYYHGGGFVIGDLEMFDHVCRYICAETGYKVFAVDYRKAPEYAFPAGIEDGVAGYKWAIERAGELGIDKGAVYIAGDSAGACLSTVITQQLVKEDFLLPRKQLLFYPTCDWSQDYQSTELFSEGFFLTKNDFIYFGGHYQNGCDLSDPRISPLRGELKGMPSSIVVTAGFDPLRDQGDAYAESMKAAGVDVVHIREEGMIHGFVNLVGFSQYARNVVSGVLNLLKT